MTGAEDIVPKSARVRTLLFKPMFCDSANRISVQILQGSFTKEMVQTILTKECSKLLLLMRLIRYMLLKNLQHQKRNPSFCFSGFRSLLNSFNSSVNMKEIIIIMVPLLPDYS